MSDIRIMLHQPKPEPQPSFEHTDVDGDRLRVTTAAIPNVGPGVYFRTDPNGSSVPVAELPALIERLQVIAEAAVSASEGEATE